MAELSEEQRSIVDKVQKLLRLANKNPNEAEAASATAKAQQLLADYNLDMAMVGEHGGSEGKREQAKLKGGAYKYQRWLWSNVASLNFCLHWCDQRFVTYKVKTKRYDGSTYVRDWQRIQWHHFLVGRVVNVVATRSMAEYLEQAVERLVRERLADKVTGEVPHTQLFSKWAVSYRTGATDRIVEKIQERRDELLKAEHERQAAARRAGTGSGSALTLASYIDSERDANADAIMGEGWSAKQAAERASKAARRREAEEEYTRWAAEHPEEARKEEAKRRKEEEKASKRRSRRNAGEKFTGDVSAYYAGYDAGKSISIDPQVGNGNTTLRIEK